MNEPHIEMKNAGFPKNEFRFPDRIHLSEQDKMAIVMQDVLNEQCERTEEFLERVNEMEQPAKPGILSRMRQWLAQRRSRLSRKGGLEG